MANQPCCKPIIRCAPTSISGLNVIAPDPSDPNNPFLPNLSSELPDPIIYVGVWYPPPQQPPLGGTWLAASCVGVCVSSISQADANACAQRANLICLSINWPKPTPNPNVGATPPPGFPPFPPTIFTPAGLFLNEEQSCTFPCPDGSPSVFTVPAGTYYAFSQATANQIAYQNACAQAIERRLCVSALNQPFACVNSAYSGVIAVASQSPTFAVSLVAGTLPTGVSLSQIPGAAVISGTPTTMGAYTFTVRVTDSFGTSTDREFTLSVVSIATTSPLPEGEVGSPYSFTFTVTPNFDGPIIWSVVGGAMPSGMSLDPITGNLSGTPTVAASNNIVIQASNGLVDCSKSFTFTAEAAPVTCTALDSTTWGTPAYNDSGGLQTVTGSWSGKEFQFSIDAPVTNTDASAQNTGNCPLNGPAMVISLTINWNAPPNNGALQWSIQIGTSNHGDLALITQADMNYGSMKAFNIFVPPTVSDELYVIVTGSINSTTPQQVVFSGEMACVVGELLATSPLPDWEQLEWTDDGGSYGPQPCCTFVDFVGPIWVATGVMTHTGPPSINLCSGPVNPLLDYPSSVAVYVNDVLVDSIASVGGFTPSVGDAYKYFILPECDGDEVKVVVTSVLPGQQNPICFGPQYVCWEPPNWSNISWGSPVITNGYMVASKSGIKYNNPDALGSSDVSGTLIYNGPAVIGSVNIAFGDTPLVSSIHLLIQVDGNTVLDATGGVGDYGFLVPDTGGAAKVISIFVEVTTGLLGGENLISFTSA